MALSRVSRVVVMRALPWHPVFGLTDGTAEGCPLAQKTPGTVAQVHARYNFSRRQTGFADRRDMPMISAAAAGKHRELGPALGHGPIPPRQVERAAAIQW